MEFTSEGFTFVNTLYVTVTLGWHDSICSFFLIELDCADTQAGLCLCCKHATKSGFLTTKPIFMLYAILIFIHFGCIVMHGTLQKFAVNSKSSEPLFLLRAIRSYRSS